MRGLAPSLLLAGACTGAEPAAPVEAVEAPVEPVVPSEAAPATVAACTGACTPSTISCQLGQQRTCQADDQGCGVWVDADRCESGYCDGEASCGPATCEAGTLKTCAEAGPTGCVSWTSKSCASGFCFSPHACGEVTTVEIGEPGRVLQCMLGAGQAGEVWVGGSSIGPAFGPRDDSEHRRFLARLGDDYTPQVVYGSIDPTHWAWNSLETLADGQLHAISGPPFREPYWAVSRVDRDGKERRLGSTRWREPAMSPAITSDGQLVVAAGEHEAPGSITRVALRAAAPGESWPHPDTLWRVELEGTPRSVLVGPSDSVTALWKPADEARATTVSRWTSDGTPVWELELSAPASPWGLAGRRDVEHVYAYGATSRGPRGERLGATDWLLVAVTAQGQQSWSARWGTDADDLPVDAAMTRDGGVVVAGVRGSMRSSDVSKRELAIVAYGPDGVVDWEAFPSTGDHAAVHGVVVATDGRIHVLSQGDRGKTTTFVTRIGPEPLSASGGASVTTVRSVTGPPVDPEQLEKVLPRRAVAYMASEVPEQNPLLFTERVDDGWYVVLPVEATDELTSGPPIRMESGVVTRRIDLARLPAAVRDFVGTEVIVYQSGPVTERCRARVGNPVAFADDVGCSDDREPDEVWHGSRRMVIAPLELPPDCGDPDFAVPLGEPQSRLFEASTAGSTRLTSFETRARKHKTARKHVKSVQRHHRAIRSEEPLEITSTVTEWTLDARWLGELTIDEPFEEGYGVVVVSKPDDEAPDRAFNGWALLAVGCVDCAANPWLLLRGWEGAMMVVVKTRHGYRAMMGLRGHLGCGI